MSEHALCPTMPPGPTAGPGALQLLLTWLSPAFPVGGFSYSHGIEYAVEAGLVGNAEALRTWIEDVLRFGAGRTDAILLGCAWRAEDARDAPRLRAVLDWAHAFRGTAELALESSAQGRAFLTAVRAAWPHPRLDALAALLVPATPPPGPLPQGEREQAGERARAHKPSPGGEGATPGLLTRGERVRGDGGRTPAYPVAVGVACAAAGIGENLARLAFLQAFAASLVSAGVRLIPLGQSDGLRVLAALEPVVRVVEDETAGLDLTDLGSAAWMADWCSARHETQYTRLFRS